MRYKVGRFFQLVGLIVLPIALAGNASEKMSLKDMLLLSAFGGLVFFVGWLLQQSARPQ